MAISEKSAIIQATFVAHAAGEKATAQARALHLKDAILFEKSLEKLADSTQLLARLSCPDTASTPRARAHRKQV